MIAIRPITPSIRLIFSPLAELELFADVAYAIDQEIRQTADFVGRLRPDTDNERIAGRV